MQSAHQTIVLGKMKQDATGTRALDALVKLLPGEKKRIYREVPNGATSVIDVGCGVGLLTYCISQRLPAASVVGVDADPDYLHQARQERSSPNLEFVDGHIEDIAKGPFDVAVFCSVIEHLPNVGSNLTVLNRLVAQGGCLLLDTDNAYSLKFLLASMYYAISKRKPSLYLWHDQERYFWWNHHLYSWTLSTLATLLAMYGFVLDDFWFTNHYRSPALIDRISDAISWLIPGLRRHMVLKLRKVGEPVIHERAPDFSVATPDP